MAISIPCFWGFRQQVVERVPKDSLDMPSWDEEGLQAVRRHYLGIPGGVIARLRDDPCFLLASAKEQARLTKELYDLVEQETTSCRELWRIIDL